MKTDKLLLAVALVTGGYLLTRNDNKQEKKNDYSASEEYITSDWREVTQLKEFDYWTPSNFVIPANLQAVEIYAEFLNVDGTEISSEMCCAVAKNTYGGYTVLCYSLTYPITFKVRLVAKCTKKTLQ